MDFSFSNLVILKILVWFSGIATLLMVFYSYKMLWSNLTVKLNMLTKNFVINCQSLWFQYSFTLKFFISWSFLVILQLNLWGMIPYIFGLTSQMMFVIIVSVSVYLSIFFFGLTWKMIKFVAHLVPQGSPLALASFLAMVEMLSNLIRPLTLALRLSINMTTGHIFISLLSGGILSLLLSNSMFSFFCGLVIFCFYLMFEFMMCFMQAVVFNILFIQYVEEVQL